MVFIQTASYGQQGLIPCMSSFGDQYNVMVLVYVNFYSVSDYCNSSSSSLL